MKCCARTSLAMFNCNVTGCLGLLLNVLCLVVIFTYSPMRRSLTNVFIANLAVADSTASLLCILEYATEDVRLLNKNDSYDQVICRLWNSKCCLWTALFTSVYCVVALTFERYIGIVHPFWHRVSFDSRKVLIC